jgi:hypothetical protein
VKRLAILGVLLMAPAGGAALPDRCARACNRAVCAAAYAGRPWQRLVCHLLGARFARYRDCLVGERGRDCRATLRGFVARHLRCLCPICEVWE